MRRQGRNALLEAAALVAVTLAAATACGTSRAPGAAAPAASPAPAAPASSAPAGSSGPATAPASCASGGWRSAPVTITRRVAVPPVPVITAVRTAQHPVCGFDRLVFDISGPVPGYTIRYVSQVTADPSGKSISVPGRRYLLLTLHQAQAHRGTGTATIPRSAQVLSPAMLAGWALAGDFEGVVTVAIGLNAATNIRVGELPGRLYIDVQH
jgi:hypothetical protein